MPEQNKVMEWDDYVKYADLEISDLQGILPYDVIEDFRQKKANAEVLLEIHADTRKKSKVILGAIGGNTAAYIDPYDRETYIGENTLAKPKFALHAGRHEAEHNINGIFNLNLSSISPAESKLLCQELGIEKLDETALIEGFNESITFQKFGANDNSGYAAKEVPMAQKLESLANQNLGQSLIETFRAGQAEQFIIMLKQLATNLQMQEVLGDLTPANSQPLAQAA